MPDGAPAPRTVVAATGTSSPMSAATAEALNRRMPGGALMIGAVGRQPRAEPRMSGFRHRLGAARYVSWHYPPRTNAAAPFGPARPG